MLAVETNLEYLLVIPVSRKHNTPNERRSVVGLFLHVPRAVFRRVLSSGAHTQHRGCAGTGGRSLNERHGHCLPFLPQANANIGRLRLYQAGSFIKGKYGTFSSSVACHYVH